MEAAFSFGVGTDVSWDVDVANRGVPVFQYDHTVTHSPVEHDKVHFLCRRIVPANNGQEGETIAGVLQQHIKGRIGSCILKMDIEGDEWSVLEHADLQHLRCFSQIICEFHNFSRAAGPNWCEHAIAVMQKLSTAFEVVHVHGNNSAPLGCIGNVPFPEILEVTMASRDRYQFADTDETFPTRLDHPNWTKRADLYLGKFQFP